MVGRVGREAMCAYMHLGVSDSGHLWVLGRIFFCLSDRVGYFAAQKVSNDDRSSRCYELAVNLQLAMLI